MSVSNQEQKEMRGDSSLEQFVFIDRNILDANEVDSQIAYK